MFSIKNETIRNALFSFYVVWSDMPSFSTPKDKYFIINETNDTFFFSFMVEKIAHFFPVEMYKKQIFSLYDM